MPVPGFHSEWFTIDDHRVLLKCRAGYPGERERFIATVVARLLDSNSSDGQARLVQVFYDDKACVYSIEAASTDPADRRLESPITDVLQSIFNSGNYICSMEVVKRGDEHSDHYHHMEHLSVALNVAEDRWKKR
ncbi:hypothetical protein [Pseudomonas aeruginosa]|uniref:hypothetical protein n=1 Tax=Pseudomonas aeruginosa TaxID=287 RepID=UPI001D0AA26F|nr:hypothetical protein [Pseudomonas aeruginosa]MCC0191373.1 hypothetical protein [Pseudomonas aeruginosa]MCC0223103.1 hypothetical protein [Pseudomonas aeruginosa]MCC0453338.1 hypothetical protein [Pseudomonas aeruginosa]